MKRKHLGLTTSSSHEVDRRGFLGLILGAALSGLVKPIPDRGGPSAEATVILATLVQPEQLEGVESVLLPDSFQDLRHRNLFRWMISRRRLGLTHDHEAIGNLALQSRSTKLGYAVGRLWRLVEDRPDAPNAVTCALDLPRQFTFLEKSAQEHRGSYWERPDQELIDALDRLL